MTFRRFVLFTMVALLAAPSAFAQVDDDLFVPLTPVKPASPKKAPKRGKGAETKKPKPTRTPKKATSERGSSKNPRLEAQPESLDDGLLVPLKERKTELLVKLAGNLKGARLYVDDQEVGPLPGPAQTITPGAHTIVVRRPGYRDFSRRIKARAGRVTQLTASLKPVAGVVAVSVNVPGASVRIDGKPAGTAPLSDVLLKTGWHDIEAHQEGYVSERKRLGVRAGRDYTVDFQLRPSPDAPKPVVAVVAREDRPAVPTPTPAPTPAPVLVPPEPKPQPESPALAALAPEEAPVVAEVQGGKPLLKRWYFWAGVGAVAAAAVVGTVAMTQNGPATPLTLRDVCGEAGCDGSINAPTGSGIVRF